MLLKGPTMIYQTSKAQSIELKTDAAIRPNNGVFDFDDVD